MKVACCWSGGKDSCYAFWKAVALGHDVRYLVNFATIASSGRNASHGLRNELIRLQAEAAGIPLIQRETTWQGYEQSFREVMNELRNKGIEGLVTGDIDIVEHRTWTENICGEVGLEALLPLWKLDRREIMTGFVDEGFESIVVCLKAEILDETWLGRRIDRNFISELLDYGQGCHVDICGENGEYHTFVVDGPAFHKRISVTLGGKVLSEGYWFQDITQAKLVEKRLCK
jgi:diphthine-ammonia ligase